MINFLSFICGHNISNIIPPQPIKTTLTTSTQTNDLNINTDDLNININMDIDTDTDTNSNHNLNLNPSLNFTQYKKLDLGNISGNFYVESVYDGDTITILIPIKIHIYDMKSLDQIDWDSDSNKSNTIYLNKVRVRLLGLDTPEIKPSKDIPNRDEHIKKAKEARDFLAHLILNKIVHVKFCQNDKYGRPLCEIFSDSVNLNDLMIMKGFGKRYSGKTKDSNF